MTQKIVYENSEGGVSIVHPTGEVEITELVSRVVPPNSQYEIVDESVIPSDRFFRDAWVGNNIGIASTATAIVEDLEKSKLIAHDIRRNKRREEFAPYDEIIMKQIPGSDATEAENSRAEIRNRYVGIQSAIEDSVDAFEIKVTLVQHNVADVPGIINVVGVGSTSVGVGSTTP